MNLLDWGVIALYLGVLVVIVWRSSRHQETSADYFLAGRNVGWFAVGASIFASNIGSEHIVGLAGQGASTGMAMAHWELVYRSIYRTTHTGGEEPSGCPARRDVGRLS